MKNLIQAAVVTLLAASTAQAQQAVQWKVSDGGNGHWYLPITTAVARPQALLQATALGGHLATITSSAENQFLASLSLPSLNGAISYWTGGVRANSGYGPWSWITGESWDYSNFDASEPNGCCGADVRFTTFRSYVGHQGKWDDTSYENAQFVLVEFDADCNGDGIVDYGQCHDGTLPDYNGNNIPDCCERGEACVVGNYPVQWRMSEGGNGHWYRRMLFSGSSGCSDCVGYMCQAQAEAYALSMQAHLVSIGSLDEGTFAGNICNCQSLWTGLTLSGGNGCDIYSWRWSDGTPISPAVMANGSGGNWCTSSEFATDLRGGQCAPWGLENLDSCWADVTGLMLEWSTDCNNDGIVDLGQILRGTLADANNDAIPDVCQQPTCRDADLYMNGRIDGADLAALLSEWGPATTTIRADINHDARVDGADLAILLSFWGPCPN